VTNWGKALGLTVLGLSVMGLAALALSSSSGEEPEGLPVTENPPDPDEITDTDEEDDGEDDE
jgi:hypothetical protein